MALEVFMRVNETGQDDGGSYIFWGKRADLRLLAEPLVQAHEANRRLIKLSALAIKIQAAAELEVPLVRLEKPEGAMLMDAVAVAAEGKGATHRFTKLYARLAECLNVY